MTVEGGGPAWRWALAAVSATVFCVQLDAFALNLALPGIGRDLGAAGGGLQWVVSGYLLAAGALMAGAGRLGDLYGRRRLLTAGLAVFGGASLVCALAPSLPVLVGARVAQGAGGAVAMPVGLALLTNACPPGTRARIMGRALGIGGVATVCGPYAGGVLTEAVSWRAVFWLNVPVALVAVGCAARAGESRDTTAPPSVDMAGLVTATGALAALAVLVDRGQLWGWASGRSATALALAVALGYVFVRHERAVANPLVDLALFGNRPFVALTAAGAAANAATVVLLFVVPLALQGPWRLSATGAGAAFLAPAAAMALAGPVAGRIRTADAVRVMAAALVLGAAALGAAAMATSLPVFLVAVTGCGAALGIAGALTLIATQAVVRPERAGEASGVTKTVITTAAGLGVALSGPAAEARSTAAVAAALMAAGGCCLAGAALLVLTRRRPGGSCGGRSRTDGCPG
ncbi:MFS transporter [Streptomyces malaysiensis subsp. malaysiensis]|uniref:MFS transporter n=1 Tax=Streptomyces malaysiensis TaxID=92644 RepID=UPI000BFDBF1F|nr:MFS transporter [Streptomyces malaysiensis]ATL87534.1 drug resistance transporter, EmrB/QacA subfamily [Streptomyces malaysiensis]QDL69066.1 MFS transporter [Streptomyces malaysiensis]